MRNISISELDDDDDMDIELGYHGYMSTGQSFTKRPLVDLFNFEDEVWVRKLENSQVLSLDEELELYDILDAEDIVDDGAIEVDSMVETIMAGV
ncbi:hypothetical protein PQX77_018189 [Marasmius sp. AFHP31]|nr:hypothetical protein PQX77_018189 [Marasmius sp. AFHP31]